MMKTFRVVIRHTVVNRYEFEMEAESKEDAIGIVSDSTFSCMPDYCEPEEVDGLDMDIAVMEIS